MVSTLNNILVTLTGSATIELPAYDVESDDDSVIFGDTVACVSGEVVS